MPGRTRQFEYAWLRTLSGRYTDFWRVTEDGLVFAAKALQVELTPEKRSRLMDSYLKLGCWPDVPAALSSLKKAGMGLAFLSNLTAAMLEAGIRNSHLDGVFDHVLSTDRVKVYKPDPRAYQMAVDAFGFPRDQILFAAFAGWDAAGAKAFGYPTFWVNRQNQPAEELGLVPDRTGGKTKSLSRSGNIVLWNRNRAGCFECVLETNSDVPRFSFGAKWNQTGSGGGCNLLKTWWPGTESNRRRQPFQGWIRPGLSD